MIMLSFTLYLKMLDKFVTFFFFFCYLEKHLKLVERKHNPLNNTWHSHIHCRQPLGTGGHFFMGQVSPVLKGHFQPGFVYRRELWKRGTPANEAGSLGGGGGTVQSREGWGLSPTCALTRSPSSVSAMGSKWGKGLSLQQETSILSTPALASSDSTPRPCWRMCAESWSRLDDWTWEKSFF